MHMTTYAKFLKEILSNKRKIEDHGIVALLARECGAIISSNLPPKLKDQGSLSVPCSIEKIKYNFSLCNLSASACLMPHSIFKKLEIGDLKPTSISLELVDH